jgi:uncharacterized repeat protein (TIGR01451 family)
MILHKAPFSPPTDRVKPSLLRLAASLLLALLLVTGPAAQAQAQDIDWVVNINDTGSDPTPAGGTISYGLTIQNAGLDNAPATTVTLDIPAGATLTGVTTLTGCTALPFSGPGAVTCNVPPLAADATLSSVVSVVASASGSVTVTASVPTAGDVEPDNNSESETTTIIAGADLAIGIAGPTSVTAGSVPTFTGTVTNLGPDPASGMTVVFPVPDGLDNLTLPAFCTRNAARFLCAIPGTLNAGDSFSFDVTGRVTAASSSDITAIADVVAGSPPDPVSSNNVATLNIDVTAGSDLRLTKTRAPSGQLIVGDTVTFTLAGSHSGDAPTNITIADTLPANYSFVSASGTGWTCTNSGQTVECLRPGGAGTGGDIALPPVTITATVVSPGTPVNTATIAAEGPVDPNPGNNTANDGGATIVDPTIDLAAIKIGPNPNLTVVGNSYTFRLRARNLGTAPFFGTVELEDTLPAGLTVTAAAGAGWTCSPALPLAGPASLFCTRVYTQASPLNPGAATPDVVLTATATATGTQINTLTVSSPDPNLPDLNPGNDTTSVTTEGSLSPDSTNLRVAKTALTPSVVAGDVQSFRIEIVNEGPQPATAITLTDDLTNLINDSVGPTGAGFIGSATVPGAASGLTCSAASISATGRRLTCTIPALPVCTAGVDCPVVTVDVRPGSNGGSRTNEATAFSANVADTNPADNTGTATYAVTPRTDVTITKVAAPSPAFAGQNLVYVLTATNINNGLSDAENVRVVDLLPPDVTFLSVTPSVGSCPVAPAPGATTVAGDEIRCDLGTILNGAQRTVTVVVSPNSDTRGTNLVNEGSVSTTTPDLDPGNDDVQVTTPVSNPRLDLLTNKTDSIDPVAIGEDTVYTVTIRNNGPSVAENATMTDTLPSSRLSFQGVSVNGGGTCSTVPAVGAVGGTVVCSWPRLGAGETRIATITMRGVTKGPAQNVATVTSDESLAGFDTNPSNDTARQITTVRTRADMEVASKVPSVDPANLREPFTYTITVRNNAGAGLAEADDVVLTDPLPAGMELTGTPTASVISGSASQTACTGTAGAISFTCALGTVATGSVVQITVPVEIVAVTSYPQSFTNTATISTSSLDVVPSNNSASNTMTINSSSLSGRLFRDFANDSAPNGNDTGIAGITMTLAGTAIDGASISVNATTDAAGNYTFPFVPQGTYTLTQGTISEAWLQDGIVTPGTAGGTVASAISVTGVALPANTAATGYLFAKVPTARVGLAKRAAATTVQADGSVLVNFELRLRNFSLEPLVNVAITDSLAGATPTAFGSFVTVPTPATSPLAAGQYTIVSPPSNGCGPANPGFNGSTDTTVITGATRPISATTCTIAFQLRYQPVVPQPTPASGNRWQNQARVTAEGQWSGQTSATNPQLDDLSNDGINPDPNNNGSGIDNNTPTPVNPAFTPAISLVKTADTTGIGTPVAPGNPITYSFTVRNTGNVTLTDVVVTDPLLGGPLAAGPITVLLPGESVVQTQVYALTAADIAAQGVTNQATATGTWRLTAGGAPQTVSDLSGTAEGNDTPTVVDLGNIALVKTADNSALSVPPAPGDVVTYSFTVSNLGSATLTDVTVSDPLPGLNPQVQVIPSLPGGTDATVTATYTLTQADIDRGFVENSASVTGTFGTDGSGNAITVSDISGATVTDDTPTVVRDLQAPSIAVVKIADASGVTNPAAVGQQITYTFDIRNTGNTTLTIVTLIDPLFGASPIGTPIASLAPGQTVTAAYSAAYPITQGDIDAGQVTNQASVTGGYTDQNGDPQSVSDLSGASFTDDDPTVVPLSQAPGLDLVKTVDTSGLPVPTLPGATLPYTFQVENTGNVTLTGVTVTDPLLGPSFIAGPVTLTPGQVAVFTGTYAVTQADIDAGAVTNQALASGGYTDPVTGPQTIDDLSGPTPGTDDPTVAPIPRAPGLQLVKTADTSGLSAPPVPGNVIAYTFEVTNTGSTTLSNITVADPLPGLIFAPVAVPTLAPAASAIAATATYAITQADIDAGVVSNTATATGTDPVDGPVTGSDTVATPLDQIPGIDLVKTVSLAGLSTPPVAGEILTYSFTVTNTGSVTLTDVTVTDPLPNIVITGGPITLAPGASSTAFSATYAITQGDIDAGLVINQATATGNYVNPITGPGTVSDLSGTAFGQDDPTVASPGQNPGIAVVKTADISGLSSPPVAGEEIAYVFEITNTGNVTLTNVTLTDPLPNLNLTGSPIPFLIPGDTNATAYSATYTLTQADIDAGGITNQATAEGSYTDPVTGPGSVSDLSGTSIGTDDPTTVPLDQQPAITLIKRATVNTPSGIVSAPGDEILYSFEVQNTGNVTLTDITLDDPLPNLSLSGGPIPALAPGDADTTTFTASYTVVASDFVAAEVVNQATATGTADVGGVPTPVTGVSGTDVGNTDPTVVSAGTPSIAFQIDVTGTTDTDLNGRLSPGDLILYGFTVTNTGNVTLSNVQVDLSSLFMQLVSGNPLQPDTTTQNPLPNLVCNILTLQPGETATFTCTGASYTVRDTDAGAGSLVLNGVAEGTSPASIVVSAASAAAAVAVPVAEEGPPLVATKAVSSSSVLVGDVVRYTIEIAHGTGERLPVDIRIVDALPQGIAYREGTARLDGARVEPVTRGETLVFPATTLNPGSTVIATFDAAILAGDGPGTRTNDAWAINGAGTRVTNVASADVRLVTEPVFSCGTILGRVFDDRNRDGIFNEDGGTTEAGLPGVRLVAPNGTAVFTDEFGRFTLPCEALPPPMGQPFQLKLDERTLPAGFEMTTENPLVVRLTAGTVVLMPFGATLPERTVSIDVGGDSLTSSERATVEASRALDALGLRVQYSGLAAQPRLNVATIDLADEAAPGSRVTFQASTNYPGWIARSELVIFDTRTRATVARLPMPPNGTIAWDAPLAQANLAYALEVFDAEGRRDITRPRPLAIRENPTGPAAEGPIEGFLSEDRALERGIPVSGGQVVVSGADIPPGTTVEVMGETIVSGPWRTFAVDRILPPGAHGLTIASSGETVTQTVEIPRAEWFVTAIGTVTIGRDFNEGQIAAYAEGQLASGQRIRAMIDTDARPLDELFDGMFDPSPERILRDLDDTVPFFTTGDDSIQEDLAPTSGRLYGLIEDDTWSLAWGDFETDDALSGLARSNRTQYGAIGEWTSDAITSNGDPRVRVTGFAAQARTAVQRDAIEANGGSIYFLSQRDIVKDSETVMVEVRDRISRQVLSSRTLTRDTDYRLNTIQGTILLDEPLVSSTSGDGIAAIPGGATVTVLVVVYDYLPVGGVDALVAGGRVEGWVTDSLRLGAEGQQDQTTAPDTTVLALDLLYQPTEGSSVLVELGQSDGPGLGLAASQNGGLTVDRFAPTGTGETAYAQRITGELSFGDVGLGEGFLSFFLAHEDEGFADPDGLVEADRWRGRLAANVAVGEDTYLTFGGRFINEDDGIDEADGWIGLAHAWSQSSMTAVELRRVDQSGPSADVETGARTDFAIRQTIAASDRLTWWVYGQATLDVEGDISRDDRVGFGAEIAMYDTIAFAGDLSYGTLGWGVDIGIVETDPDGHSRRFAYRLDPDRRLDTGLSGPENGAFVVSGERLISENWSQTAEATYDIFDETPSLLNAYGVTWTPSTEWRFQFAALSGTSVEPDGEEIDRTGLSFGMQRTVELGTTVSARLEWAQNRSTDEDNPDTNTDTYAFRWASETLMSDDWRLLTRLDMAVAESAESSAIDGRFTEADIGYAYRPAASDDLIGLISYTFLLDEPGPDQVNIDGDDEGLGQRSHIVNMSLNKRVSERWSMNAKYGWRYRMLLSRDGDDLGSGTAQLGVLRFDYHVTDEWDVLAEGRVMYYDGLGSQTGALLAVARDLTEEVDIGVGYLWGDTPDNLRQIDPADEGFFVTLTASF